MRKLSTTKPFSCATCGREIVGRGTFHVGLPFCCAACVAGGRCRCEATDRPEPSVRHCLDISALFADTLEWSPGKRSTPTPPPTFRQIGAPVR